VTVSAGANVIRLVAPLIIDERISRGRWGSSSGWHGVRDIAGRRRRRCGQVSTRPHLRDIFSTSDRIEATEMRATSSTWRRLQDRRKRGPAAPARRWRWLFEKSVDAHAAPSKWPMRQSGGEVVMLDADSSRWVAVRTVADTERCCRATSMHHDAHDDVSTLEEMATLRPRAGDKSGDRQLRIPVRMADGHDA